MIERAGRAVAGHNRFAVVDSVVVNGQAHMRHHIPYASDVLDRLLKSDFRIAPEAILTVLRQVGVDLWSQ